MCHSPEDFNKAVPPECAIKVFKTTLNEFKNRDRYIKDDFRFKDACKFGKQNPRKFIKLWAEKEMYNLNRYVILTLNFYGTDSTLYNVPAKFSVLQ